MTAAPNIETTARAEATAEALDLLLDAALEDSFPASDPVAFTRREEEEG
ncbi:MAG TPA: hypothetical protein VEA15_01425 [Caulobacteraceae bacterium]|nr:hypothetical protein [Caulobacteraceae bacterium]